MWATASCLPRKTTDTRPGYLRINFLISNVYKRQNIPLYLKCVDPGGCKWKALDGTAHGKKTLKLRPNVKNLYTCAVKLCLHADFKSCRGLRKHINTKHPWYYYFEKQPEVKREDMAESLN